MKDFPRYDQVLARQALDYWFPRLEGSKLLGQLPPGEWRLVEWEGMVIAVAPGQAARVVIDGEVRILAHELNAAMDRQQKRSTKL